MVSLYLAVGLPFFAPQSALRGIQVVSKAPFAQHFVEGFHQLAVLEAVISQ